ncbi:hypothetical protein [Prochlorococcus sp. MIT 1341]|uniref:hypothetical protein n=1 Tax=Prochlorococcus sp. MIT 1341 TaxID=3096221 RepID=UPI002A75E67A|nr:hypothetical protein [Prochlorococcus sp. MIT 1341]
MPRNFKSTNIETVLKKSKGELEIQLQSNGKFFKIDLKPENLHLWRETFERYQNPYNLLLSCEDDSCDLGETHLTWVVGSAIRPFRSKNCQEAIELLKVIGVDYAVAELIKENCGGLGENESWSFFLDRHNILTASPILCTRDIDLLSTFISKL